MSQDCYHNHSCNKCICRPCVCCCIPVRCPCCRCCRCCRCCHCGPREPQEVPVATGPRVATGPAGLPRPTGHTGGAPGPTGLQNLTSAAGPAAQPVFGGMYNDTPVSAGVCTDEALAIFQSGTAFSGVAFNAADSSLAVGSAGAYKITYKIDALPSANSVLTVNIKVNGISIAADNYNTSSANEKNITGFLIANLSAGDTISMYLSAANTMTLTFSQGIHSLIFLEKL